MARLIPSRPHGSLPRGATRLYAAFKSALPDTWTVWHRMQPGQECGPDFLLLNEVDLRAILVRCLRQPKSQVLAGAELESQAAGLKDFVAGTLHGPLVPLVLFHHELDSLPKLPEGVRFLGAEALKDLDLETRLLALGGMPLMRSWLASLRSAFSPESVISPTHLMGDLFQAHESPVTASIQPTFLDYRQEHLTKRDLELPAQAQASVGDFRVRLLTGVAGGGKTLILLHRAALLARHFPKARILVLTYNKALNSELQRRLKEIGAHAEVHCHSFYSWCGSSWKSQGKRNRLDLHEKHTRIKEEAIEAFGAASPLVKHLESELDWIHLAGFKVWEEYRDSERKGQGFRLTQAQRKSVWDICLRWRGYLEEHSLGDFPHFSWRFLHALRDGLEPSGTWDFILVDEAQFFAPTWFEILRKHLKPQGNLFLCADPSQGFLRHGLSWQAAGLEVRGRTDRLQRSYRTTRQILSMAWKFLSSHAQLDAEESVVPDISTMRDGAPPELMEAKDLDGEVRLAAASIKEHLNKGIAARSMLVLIAEGESKWTVQKKLAELTGTVVQFADEAQPHALRLCSLDAATGLEAPLVYVLGASHLLEAEGNPTLSPEELEELRDRNGRRLYMGFTRAGVHLYIGWTGKVPPELRTDSHK